MGREDSVLRTREERHRRGSDGDSQAQLWPDDDGGIMKTVSVQVTTTGHGMGGSKSGTISEESQEGNR